MYDAPLAQIAAVLVVIVLFFVALFGGVVWGVQKILGD